jgi:hypothetical protein
MNTWQSPTAGEPSLGEWHTHIEEILNTNPASTSDMIVTVSSTSSPVGTKMIAGYFTMTMGAGSGGLVGYIKDMSGNIWNSNSPASTGPNRAMWFEVPLDANKQFKWCVSGAAVDSMIINMRKYSL